MIAISYDIKSTLVTKRTHARLMRLVNRNTITELRDRILPDKFTAAGAREYAYEKRAKGYQIRKAQTKGHQRPLEFTGRLKRTFQSSFRITATATRAKLRARSPFPLSTERRRELEAISDQDSRQLELAAVKQSTRLANKPQFQRKTRRRGGK